MANCELCGHLFDLLKQIPLSPKMNKFEKLQKHKQLSKWQQDQFIAQKQNLQLDQCFIV